MKLKIGLASSSDRKWVEGYLKNLNLFNYFDYLCTKEQVENVKPDPELYLNALSHFKIAGNEAIAFEDSPNGASAANKAGIYCVIVPNGITSNLNFDRYDLIIDSLKNINLTMLLKQLNKA